MVNENAKCASPVYEERLSSQRTEALFLLLTFLFLALALRRAAAAGRGRLVTLLSTLSLLFLFYALNYRVLLIRLAPEELQLRFGLFRWTTPMGNVESRHQDEASLWRIGGAGIHFSWFGGRYRAMFNFVEYPRVVVALKEKRGPVRDIAFSTQQPELVMALLQEFAAEWKE